MIKAGSSKHITKVCDIVKGTGKPHIFFIDSEVKIKLSPSCLYFKTEDDVSTWWSQIGDRIRTRLIKGDCPFPTLLPVRIV